MHNIVMKKFKGEIENYLRKQHNNFDSKINSVFQRLCVKTCLSGSRIVKKSGVPTYQILFILIMAPFLHMKTINSYYRRILKKQFKTGKDAYYRFKEKSYSWRTFLNQFNKRIFSSIQLEKTQKTETFFVVDDTLIQKLGKMIENVSYVYDHNTGKSVLGFCTVVLGLFTEKGFYVLDFAWRFGKKRHPKSPEIITDNRTSSGKRCYEAKHKTKLESALSMMQSAVDRGITAGYALFDSWYANPSFISSIRNIADGSIHVICRLKNNKTSYIYNGNLYRVSDLYKKVKSKFRKDKKTGLELARINVLLPHSNEEAAIVFCKGYREPENSEINGKKQKKKCKWSAFLSTDASLHSSSIIKKYTRRWSIEICFKECKQMLDFGKDQSNNFNSQLFAATASFFRYNLLGYINEKENYGSIGALFEHIVDEATILTYSERLWWFFKELFSVGIKAIFDLFKIESDFRSFNETLTHALTGFTLFQRCET